MGNEESSIREQLNRLSDEMIDDIINTPDAEILREVKEEYGDPSFLANRAREILKKSQIKAGKYRLQSAREELKKTENKVQKDVENISNFKEALSRFIKDNPEFEDELTLAARNGKEITEEDAKSILEDLVELKYIQQQKDD